MARLLAALAVAWPLAGAAAVAQQAAGGAAWTVALHLAASRICHQQPERSFATAGVQWPVCARCSGLYLGAAVAAPVALLLGRRRSGSLRAPSAWRMGMLLAAVPTALTWAMEWLGAASITNVLRFAAALPLGAAVAVALIAAASSPPDPIR